MATDNTKDVSNYDLRHDEPELQYLWMGSAETEPYVHRAPGCHALRRGDQVHNEDHRYSSVLRPRELLTARRNQN